MTLPINHQLQAPTKQADAGLIGGEGCQWPTYISFDQVDGSLAFLGIDVGGMYRSKDGGKTWINLCREPNDGSVGPDGGKKPQNIVFNRKYNEVWTNSACRGVWKISAVE